MIEHVLVQQVGLVEQEDEGRGLVILRNTNTRQSGPVHYRPHALT